jgi:hypothetical protein
MRLPFALAAAASILTLSAPAFADDDWRGGPPRGWGGYEQGRGPPGYRDNGYRDNGYYAPARGYPQARGGWYDPRFDNRNARYNNRCRNNDGAAGTVLGAVLGGVIGNQVAGRGDRTLGTVLGAGVGAVAGRAIERGGQDRRCRW